MTMLVGSIISGQPGWVVPTAILLAVAVALAAWSYRRSPGPAWVRATASMLRLVAVIALALCLIDPLFSGVRPRPHANRFVILADNSESMTLRGNTAPTRGQELQRALQAHSPWQARLGQDFELRRYAFDNSVRPLDGFEELSFRGESSALKAALESLPRGLYNQPTAGVLLFTDGNATDGELRDDLLHRLPPIYPVVFGQEHPRKDVRVQRVAVTQSNFEATPVSVLAETVCQGYAGSHLLLELLDESGQPIQHEVLREVADDRPLAHRFQFRPTKSGVTFYRVRAVPENEKNVWQSPERSSEATLHNNTRWLAVDRGRGPYRILYVCGRPNWEFKFLRRAAEEDEEIQVVGLVRIAKREAKFTFRGHQGETTNPLYRGFDNQKDEKAEQYDQPVLIRLGTEDEKELRDGFPKSAADLFRYHAIVLDDIEAGFFTQDQMSLMQQFVSQRGGGLLMLGGQESFSGGRYQHTPLAELLPVYLEANSEEAMPESFRWNLTREGWLQPWVRLRATEADEQVRLRGSPELKVLNAVRGIKPGATVLAEVATSQGKPRPALVVQRFGRGQSAALLVGDLWRWSLRRPAYPSRDLEQSWRQTLRWLVADVPGRVDVEVQQPSDLSTPIVLAITVRDELYRPLDNASLKVQVETPDKKEISLQAESSDREAGVYHAKFAARASGPYRAQVTAKGDDGKPIGQAETGWTSDPQLEEFAALSANTALLERLAERTGGEVVSGEQLDRFVSSLPQRKIPIMETWTYPLWHQWPVFLLAIASLVGEWGLRRWKGLA